MAVVLEWRPPPIFGDREYQEIRNQMASIPISGNALPILESWELLCATFAKHAENLESLNQRIIAWNPNNAETQKVKEIWLRIYSSLQDAKTDRRESVLAGLFILTTIFKQHHIKEADDHLTSHQIERERNIKEKIKEFFPESITCEQAMRYALENGSAFTEFNDMSTLWFPREEPKRLLSRRVASLLMLLNPQTERQGTIFQEKLLAFRPLRLSESDLLADPDIEMRKEIEAFFPESITYEQARDRVFKDKPAFAEFEDKLRQWAPQGPKGLDVHRAAISLLIHSNPLSERHEKSFQEDFQDLQRLLKEDASAAQDPEERKNEDLPLFGSAAPDALAPTPNVHIEP